MYNSCMLLQFLAISPYIISEEMAQYFKKGTVVDMVKVILPFILHFDETRRHPAQVEKKNGSFSGTGHQLTTTSSTHHFSLDKLKETKWHQIHTVKLLTNFAWAYMLFSSTVQQEEKILKSSR